MNLRKPIRWKFVLGGLILVAAARYGYKEISTPQWVTVTASFTKDDKPYGGGAFRLRGNEVMTLKIADPEVRYRVVGLEKGYDDAQAVPEEPWMDDTSELLNRSTVKFLRGRSCAAAWMPVWIVSFVSPHRMLPGGTRKTGPLSMLRLTGWTTSAPNRRTVRRRTLQSCGAQATAAKHGLN